MATNIMKELMPDAEFHGISHLEVVFGSNLGVGLQQVPAIITEIMVPLRNGRGAAAAFLLLRSSGHNG